MKWCNARSEMAGLTLCYYTDASQTTVYRTGTASLTNACVKWNANGCRLPTEAEWEKAARGGLGGQRFPWGNTIAHSNANYNSSPSKAYDVSPTRGFHPLYGSSTSPVGAFAPNGFGLYDMAGNVSEWCWDWYDSGFYGRTEANNDPRGPAAAQSVRVLRGGSSFSSAYGARCAVRSKYWPSDAAGDFGLRYARGL